MDRTAFVAPIIRKPYTQAQITAIRIALDTALLHVHYQLRKCMQDGNEVGAYIAATDIVKIERGAHAAAQVPFGIQEEN